MQGTSLRLWFYQVSTPHLALLTKLMSFLLFGAGFASELCVDSGTVTWDQVYQHDLGTEFVILFPYISAPSICLSPSKQLNTFVNFCYHSFKLTHWPQVMRIFWSKTFDREHNCS